MLIYFFFYCPLKFAHWVAFNKSYEDAKIMFDLSEDTQVKRCLYVSVASLSTVTRCCNGVTNKHLFCLFETITNLKNSGSKPLKSVIGLYKINLEA
jgi:hypothetical protein